MPLFFSFFSMAASPVTIISACFSLPCPAIAREKTGTAAIILFLLIARASNGNVDEQGDE